MTVEEFPDFVRSPQWAAVKKTLVDGTYLTEGWQMAVQSMILVGNRKVVGGGGLSNGASYPDRRVLRLFALVHCATFFFGRISDSATDAARINAMIPSETSVSIFHVVCARIIFTPTNVSTMPKPILR